MEISSPHTASFVGKFRFVCIGGEVYLHRFDNHGDVFVKVLPGVGFCKSQCLSSKSWVWREIGVVRQKSGKLLAGRHLSKLNGLLVCALAIRLTTGGPHTAHAEKHTKWDYRISKVS